MDWLPSKKLQNWPVFPGAPWTGFSITGALSVPKQPKRSWTLCAPWITGPIGQESRWPLRKKNIKLNGKKASGNELILEKDEIEIFLSDDTFGKFSSKKDDKIQVVGRTGNVHIQLVGNSHQA